MAKTDINRMTGKIGGSLRRQRKRSLESTFIDIDREERAKNPNPRIIGNRLYILEIYKKSHIREEAYKAVEEINKKFGRKVYTREMVDEWINKEFGISNNKNEKGIDDDDDAR